MTPSRKLILAALLSLNSLLVINSTATKAMAAEQIPIRGTCDICIGEFGEAVWCCFIQNCQEVACQCAWASHCV